MPFTNRRVYSLPDLKSKTVEFSAEFHDEILSEIQTVSTHRTGTMRAARNTFFLKYIAAFSLLLLLAGCLDNEKVYLGQDIIDEVKSEFVPDRRVNIFDIKTSKTEDGILLNGETNLPAAKEHLMYKMRELNVNVTDSIKILPAANLKGKNFGVVRLSVANLRSAPKHSAELSTQATLGLPLKIYKKEGDWYYVQTPDGYLGWLDSDGFTLMAGGDMQGWAKAEKVMVIADGKKVMRGDTVISDVLPGNILRKGKSNRQTTEVIFPDGRSGYLASGDVVDLELWLSEVRADTTGIFAAAYRMNGVPYLWGGTSPKGMDCSGYTKQIFFENGILLPRDASQQVHTGELIETDTTLKNLLPGDLLFFGKKATPKKKERVSHVAIYLGDGKIIHSAGNVRTQSLRRGDPDFAEDRLQTFLRAKRILGSEGKNGVVKLNRDYFFE